jgi:hypothetical protein
VHDALADGRLVRILPVPQSLPCSRAHVVHWTIARRTDDRVRCFVARLCEGGTADGDEPRPARSRDRSVLSTSGAAASPTQGLKDPD